MSLSTSSSKPIQQPLHFISRFILFLFLLIAADRITGYVLEGGIYSYFGLKEQVEYLVIGSSPAVLGTDKESLEKELKAKVAIYSMQGASTEDRLVLIEHFFSINKSNLKLIIYELTPHIFTSEGLSQNSHHLLFPFIGDKVIRSYVQKKCKSKTEFYLRLLFQTSRYNESTLNFAFRGLLKKHSNLKFGQINIESVRKAVQSNNYRKIAFEKDCISIFQKTVGYIRSKKIKCVYVFFPTIDILNEAEPHKWIEIKKMVSSVVSPDSSNYLIDYNPQFHKKYNYFFDHLHLNQEGQKVFSQALVNDLKNIR
jgi:hypothetical protein